jgi:hypothetical protein
MSMRRLGRTLGVLIILASGLTAGSLALVAGPASATSCGTAIPAGSTCSMTGTVSITGGSLTLTSPSQLAWSTTLTGSNQSLVDTNSGDQQYTVNDATGSAAGWHVSVWATPFTNGASTFPNVGTFVTNGSTSSITSTSGPTATCSTTCTLPTDQTTYPVAITTAASASYVTIYDTAASTGLGQIVIGGSTATNPVGWWVNVPATAIAGSYTSTITMQITSAP